MSAPGFLVRALAARMQADHPPFTVLSCDNLPENGNIIRHVVLSMAEHIDSELVNWIQKNGCFPSTMVDRITPATTPDDQHRIANTTGLFDASPVVHEPYSQWVIENEFVNRSHPDWEGAGAEFVSDVKPYELMKLRMLNGTHTALAYLGYLAGFQTIAETVADNIFCSFAELLWQKEIAPSLNAPAGVSLSKYATDLMKRYKNNNIRHFNWQIAMDGSQKLPQRILGVVQERHSANAHTPGLILAVAAWIRFASGVDEMGAKIEVRDPLSDVFAELASSTNEPELYVTQMLAQRKVFPEAVANILAEPVTEAYLGLLENGAHKMVRKIVQLYEK